MSPAGGPGGERRAVESLARSRGVATGYTDVHGRRRRASTETLLGVLSALGEQIDKPADALALVRARERARPAVSVVIAWDGAVAEADRAGATGSFEVVADGSSLGPLRAAATLPFGVHELIRGGERVGSVIAAPRRAGVERRGAPARDWAVFAPTYALRDRRRRATGDLTSLRNLGEVLARFGCRLVATLPLLAELATADGSPPGQRPYAPLSRMWWNEGYLDPARLPERAPGERAGRTGRHDAGHADVAGTASAMRALLGACAARAETGPRADAFDAFRRSRPDLARYARFRAAIELAGPDTARWPAAWRDGAIPADAVDGAAVLRHEYAQFAFEAQLDEDTGALARAGSGLLLDLPVGCSPSGFDPWAFPEVYTGGAAIGAPPDAFFTSGQNWGFAPPTPDGDRRDGYRVLRASLAHNLRHAAVLRIDHAMGLSRLWWVPRGMEASEGTYVRYHLDEVLAVANLEAWRAGARLVGEDLGTVERGFTSRLHARGISGMAVAMFDAEAAPGAPISPGPRTLTYVDTHDTATFVSWFDGSDIDLRERLGVASPEAAAGQRAERGRVVAGLADHLVAEGRLAKRSRRDAAAVLRALLEELGESRSEMVVVNLEDLWAEADPQNVPGTVDEHRNFSRRFALDLDELVSDGRVLGALGRLEAARRRGTLGATTARTDEKEHA